jgi:hypothetical protein
MLAMLYHCFRRFGPQSRDCFAGRVGDLAPRDHA